MKLWDKVTGLWGLRSVKVGAIALGVGFAIGMGLGWHEKGLRCDAEDLAAQGKAIEEHGQQEENSFRAGKEAEHGKQKAKAAMGAVRPAGGSAVVGIFDAERVREQTDLIAAGEGAFHRID